MTSCLLLLFYYVLYYLNKFNSGLPSVFQVHKKSEVLDQ